MRGKGTLFEQREQMQRITPAYAGKSVRIQPHNDSIEDHPRLCGEKKRQAETEVLQPGSPPPMRGKAVVVSCNGESYGITPAYAGKRVYAMIAQDRV